MTWPQKSSKRLALKDEDGRTSSLLNSDTNQLEENETDSTSAPGSTRFQKKRERLEPLDPIRWFPIIAELALAIIVCLSILVVRVQDDIYAATMIGFLFVQILVAAVWTVLAPVNLFFRIASGTSFVAFVCACLFRCAYRDGGGLNVAVAITGAMIAQWLVYQIPLWYLSWTGWQLQAPGQPIANQKADFQFGIRHLLIWTTIVGLFMGASRFVAPQFQDATTDLSSVTQQLLVLTLGNSLIVIPILWGCLSRYYFWLWSGITIGVCILVCIAETTVLSDAEVEFFWLVNAVQAVISILAMLAIRWTGYRLQRVTTTS